MKDKFFKYELLDKLFVFAFIIIISSSLVGTMLAFITAH